MDTSEQKSLVHAMLVGAGFGEVILAGAHEGLVRAVFSLLSQTRTDAAHRSELMNRIRDLDFDAENALTAMNRCKQQLEASDRANKALSSKLELAEASIKDLTEKYTIAKDEAAKSTLNLSSAMAQFKHKSKKKEAEFSALQDRLQKLTTEQLHAAKIGMRIVNPSMKKMSSFNHSTAVPATAAAKAEKHEKDLHAVVIRTYEEREKELLVELEDVKNTVYRVFQRMKAAVLKVKDADGLSTRTVFSSDSHEEARFHLPYNLVKSQINAHFESLVSEMEIAASKYEQLSKSQSSHEPVTINTIDSFELTKMQNTVGEKLSEASCLRRFRIDEYKGIIEKQQHLLDMALDTNPEYVSNHSGLPDDSQILSDLEDQKEMLQRRGEQLDEERRKFTEAAIRLGRERVAFEQEKEAYEEEMRAISTQHILSQMPDTPLWMKTQPNDTRKLAHAAPNTPTPTTNPPRARNHSAAPVSTKTPLSRIKTPADSLRQSPAGKSTPGGGISRSSSFPGGLAFAADDEFIAESSTFASTPGVLKMMMEEREVPDDEGIEGEEFPATPSSASLKVGNTRVVKSALKKSSPGTTPGSAGSLAKRRVDFGL
ncbi:hypothetical protein BJ741DRAFT_631540 [Chytriomyces cf. hyalinus JEL632]|nr:hypothetical protein BJ741DRAFT_631540 [Chytriomyces cf. hyalinus JEL632]